MICLNKHPISFKLFSTISSGSPLSSSTISCSFLDNFSKANLIFTTFKVPTFAYQVSGEFSMLKHAINQKWLDNDVMLESLLSIKRAGADAILSYAAKDISKEINNK